MDQHNPYAAPTVDVVAASAIAKLGKNALATRWQRFAGNLIDTIVLMLVFFPMIILAIFVATLYYPDYLEMPDKIPATTTVTIIETMVSIGLIAISFLILNGYLLANRGQTIGKVVMKIRIVSDQDEMVSFSKLFFPRCFWIWCVGCLPLVGWWLSLANVLAIFRSNHKCLHDEFSGTKVVMINTPVHSRPMPDKPDFSNIG